MLPSNNNSVNNELPGTGPPPPVLNNMNVSQGGIMDGAHPSQDRSRQQQQQQYGNSYMNQMMGRPPAPQRTYSSNVNQMNAARGMQQGPPQPWQNEQRDENIRRTMITKIVALLKERKPDASDEWKKKLPDMAKKLEDRLYRYAASEHEYVDGNTLQSRLQRIAMEITYNKKSAANAIQHPQMQQPRVMSQRSMPQPAQMIQQYPGMPVNPAPRNGMRPAMSFNAATPISQAPTQVNSPEIAPNPREQASRGRGRRGRAGGPRGPRNNPPPTNTQAPSQSHMTQANQGPGMGPNPYDMDVMIQGPSGPSPNQMQRQMSQNMQNMYPYNHSTQNPMMRPNPHYNNHVQPPGSNKPPEHPNAPGMNPDRQRQMVLRQQQQRLLLLRHASRCPFEDGSCQATPLCADYKKLWQHIANCRDQQCETAHCVSSRYVLSHYHRCQEESCAVCGPVRDAIDKHQKIRQQQQQQQQQHMLYNQPPVPGHPQRQLGGLPASVGPTLAVPTPGSQMLPSNPRVSEIEQLERAKREAELAAKEKERKILELQREIDNLKGKTTPAPAQLQSNNTPSAQTNALQSQDLGPPPKRRAIEESSNYGHPSVANINPTHSVRYQADFNPMAIAAPQNQTAAPRGTNNWNQHVEQYSAPLQSQAQMTQPAPATVNQIVPAVAQKQPSPQVDTKPKEFNIQSLSSLVYMFNTSEIVSHVKSLSNFSVHSKSSEIRQKATPLLNMLKDLDYAWIFAKPVDPEELKIPDYFEVIKHPMDLGTVRKNLESNLYRSLRHFANDVRLVFNNAMLYNPEKSEVHSIARQYGWRFEKEYNQLLLNISQEEQLKRQNYNACRLCGGERFTFEPPVYYCNGKCNQKIRRSAFYYVTPDNKQYYCMSCYSSFLKDQIALEDGTLVSKTTLIRKKNDEIQEESWVECNDCKHWFHQICALFNTRRNEQSRNEPFYCPMCVLRHVELLKEADSLQSLPTLKDEVNRFAAKDLPRCQYSDFLETRIRSKLDLIRNRYATANKMFVSEVEKIEDITIRVVSCKDTELFPRQGFERLYGGNYPSSFPHRVKCVLLFQKIEAVDVLILGLYTQVYGSECPQPNTRSLYIAYLDSVNYFTPGYARTAVYHELLASTMEYERKRGITKCFIWVCPPLAGDDYILYCHPREQKTPKAEMLRNWYFKLLEVCRKRGVVVSLDNLYDAYMQRVCNVAGVPNFEGDYWPGVTEQFIEQLESEKIDPKSIAPRKKRVYTRNKMLGNAAAGTKKSGTKKSSSKSKSKRAGTKNKSKSQKKQKPKQRLKSTISNAKGEAYDSLVANFEDKVFNEESDVVKIEEPAPEMSERNELDISAFIPPKPLPILELPQQDALTVKIADVIQQMKEDFIVVYMHQICACCCSNIDQTDQLFWTPAIFDYRDIDLDFTKNRYAPPFCLCHDCYKAKYYSEYGQPIPNEDELEIFDELTGERVDLKPRLKNKLHNSEKPVEDAIGTKGKTVGEASDKVSSSQLKEADMDLEVKEEIKQETKEGQIDLNLNPSNALLAGATAEENVNEYQGEEVLPPPPPPFDLEIENQVDNAMVDNEPVERYSQGVDSPKNQIEEIITILPEGQEAPRRPAWNEVNYPCSLREMKCNRTNIPKVTVDPDPAMDCQFFDTRQQFLSLCQGNHYQFDQLRRAKHSSMMVLYHLHNPEMPSFMHTCNGCGKNIGNQPRYTCMDCEFDLCQDCHNNGVTPHSHPLSLTQGNGGNESAILEKSEMNFNGDNVQNANLNHEAIRNQQYQAQKNRMQKQASIKAHMDLLVHASNCQLPNCPNKNCHKMKELLAHGTQCQLRLQGQCRICRRVWALLHVHARQCRFNNGECRVPSCARLKRHLRKAAQESQDRRIRLQTQRMQEERSRANGIGTPGMGHETNGMNSMEPLSENINQQRYAAANVRKNGKF